MEAPDVTAEHGTRVTRNFRVWWPSLTDQDIHALNTWRWRTRTGHGPEDQTGLSARRSGRRSFDIRFSGRREIGR